MKDLIIEYRDGKFVQLAIDGVEMKRVTSIQFSHTLGEDVPTLTVSGHVWADIYHVKSFQMQRYQMRMNRIHGRGGDQIFKTFAPNDRRQSLNLTLTRFF